MDTLLKRKSDASSCLASTAVNQQLVFLRSFGVCAPEFSKFPRVSWLVLPAIGLVCVI